MKYIISALLIIFSVTAFSQSKINRSYNKLEIIESSNIALLSYSEDSKIEGAKKSSSLVFVNMEDDSTEKFTVEDKIIKYTISKTALYKAKRFVIIEVRAETKLVMNPAKKLFICTIEGKEAKQLSPENFTVNSWSLNEDLGKLILIGTEDTNGDGKFNNKDTDRVYTIKLSEGTNTKEIVL